MAHFGFGGEESAGASFLRGDGPPGRPTGWLHRRLAGCRDFGCDRRDPGEHYQDLEKQFSKAWYARKDAPVTPAWKKVLANLSPEKVQASELAGDKITAKLTRAPYNQAPIGGLKVVTDNGWFAARPSGTEDVYKIYAESFVSEEHLSRIQSEAQSIVDKHYNR
jgi:phosphoglucomutase